MKPLALKSLSKNRIIYSFIVLICCSLVFFVSLLIYGLIVPLQLQIQFSAIGFLGISISIYALFFSTFAPFRPESLRQLRQPKEFRIDSATFPQGIKLDCKTDARDLCTAFETLQKTSSGQPTLSHSLPIIQPVVFDLCTEIWRLNRKVIAEQQKGKLNDSQIPRYIERINTVLESSNIVIHDHSGERYLPGQAVKIVAVQQCEDIPHGEERIIETVKPTIYHDGIVVKQGEVIIGTSTKNEN